MVQKEDQMIQLQQFLKHMNLVSSGGEAKLRIRNGDVQVNGETETRRGRKLYPGDTVAMDGKTYKV